MVDNESDVEDWSVVGPNGKLGGRVHELPHALREHLWDVANRIDRGVIQDLESVVIDKLPIKRINKRESRNQQDTRDN